MSEFALHLHDVFRRFGAFEIRRMFSGHGLFRDGIMFALVVRETLYLKADEGTVAHFLERSLPPFEYQRQGRTATLPYHRAPEEIFEDADIAAQWALRAWEAALRRRANTEAKRRPHASKVRARRGVPASAPAKPASGPVSKRQAAAKRTAINKPAAKKPVAKKASTKKRSATAASRKRR